MNIDNNEMMKRGYALEMAGNIQEGHRLRDAFVAGLNRDGDFCSCKAECPYHGKCMECVAIHRGHRDHVPACLTGIGSTQG